MNDNIHKLRWMWRLGWFSALLLVVLGVFYGLNPTIFAPGEKGAGRETWGKGRNKSSNRPISVITGIVTPGPIRLRLDALGTVIPSRLVTVRARVDGQLVKVVFREGETVVAGQLLAEIDARPFRIQLAQAKGQLARDQALLENARNDAVRYQTLLGQDSISQQQAETQKALVRQYEGVVQMDQAQVENATLQLSYTRLTAPMAGITGLRQIDPGNMIHPGDSRGVVTIAQVRPIQVLFALPEEAIPQLQAYWHYGKTLPVELLDREQKNRLAEGRLLTVDNQIDVGTGTVKLKAEFENAEGRLFPNQFVNVTVILAERPAALLVPSAAVQRGRTGDYVFVVGDGQTVAYQPVKTGPVQGDVITIEEGLKAGDKVVVEGIDKLREGTKIQEITRDFPEDEGGGRTSP